MSPEKHSVFPGGESTYQGVKEWLDKNPNETKTAYGHGVGLLGQVLANTTAMEPEKQAEYLARNARDLIERFGPRILEVMRPELRQALSLDPEDK